MDGLTIVPLTENYASLAESWIAPDAATVLLNLSVTSGKFSSDKQSLGWVALLGKEPVAIATLTVDRQRIGRLDFLVKPSERRQGIGAAIVTYVLEQPETQTVSKLEALVEFDNTAAQKILARQGFTSVGYSSDDRLRFERH